MNLPEIPGLQCTALLNRGGTFTTWKAIQESLQREVDVKILQHDAPPEQTEHFLSISRTLAKMSHPSIAQTFDIVTEASCTYVVMEHVEGASLSEMVAGTGPLKATQALRLVQQLAEALDYAWAQSQIVFRNLKPQNLRANAQGILKISEFGLAVQMAPGFDLTRIDHGSVVGTPHYISPEQARAAPVIDTRSDMYALGTILYFLVTAKSPFEGMDQNEILKQQVSGQIPHPRTMNNQLPHAVCHLITRLMMKLPKDRYADWSAVTKDIKRLLANKDLPGHAPKHAASTIAAYAGGLKLAQPRAGDPPTALPPAGPGPRAENVRGKDHFVLWLLLMLWFTWLANGRLNNPMGLPAVLLVPIRLPALFSTAPAASSPAQRAPQRARTALQPRTGAAAAPVASPASATPTQEGSSLSDASSQADTRSPLSNPMLADIATALGAGDITEARRKMTELAKAAPRPSAELEAIRTALNTLPTPLSAVEKGLQSQIGKEIVIRYLGHDRKIIPKAIADGELQAAFIANDGSSRPVSFMIDKLDAAEQLRWLPDARTAAEHAIFCMLALQAQNAERFREHKDNTGALAPVFNSISL